jgi:molybdopterin molybdotransferase
MSGHESFEPRFRVEVAAAVQLIRERMPRYGSRLVPLQSARGAILRQEIVAERDQPPFDRVTMDGIAIRFADFDGGIRKFNVHGTQAAGAPANAIESSGNCLEIMTGAALPDDADTVIPVERIRREQNLAILEDGYVPVGGQFIHARASDHAAGQSLLTPGIRIDAPEMAVLTIGGHAEIEIAQWPGVAVISTGDELVDVGEPMAEYQIRSSNDRAIAASLEKRGCSTAVRARLPDDPERLLAEIGELHDAQDILILSGGVSMGKYDYVPQILERLGVELVFHKILQRPGLPMWFGVSAQHKPVFALPGNPVSSLVCLVRYVVPAILEAMGATATDPHRVQLAETVKFAPDLTCFMPVQLIHEEDGRLLAMPKPTNTSGDFVSLAGTDGFVELPRGSDKFSAGHAVFFYAW